MKKHPVIRYVLILVLSGGFGALLAFLMMHNEETLVSAIQAFKTWFGKTSAILHIAVCGVQDGAGVLSVPAPHPKNALPAHPRNGR